MEVWPRAVARILRHRPKPAGHVAEASRHSWHDRCGCIVGENGATPSKTHEDSHDPSHAGECGVTSAPSQEVPGEAMPRLLLVEDEPFTRVTVEAALRLHGFDVVAAVGGAHEAMEAARSRELDGAVLDLDLGPGPTGIDVAFGIRGLRPTCGIVLLTSFSDPRLLASSLKEPPAGSAYVVKQSLTDTAMLAEAIIGSMAMASGSQASPILEDLTDAQVETLRLLACGLSNAEIAAIRVVTEKSVEQAIARTAKRLGISDGNQRVLLAREYFRLTGAVRHANAHR